MDRKQRYAKYDWLLERTQVILGYYNCPESCDASCCKKHCICFYRKEYENILKTIDKESANILKSNAVKSELEGCYKAINAEQCPLLMNSKCRIYESRPEPCRKFPFETYPDTDAGFVLTLILCPMSINIIHDYAQWHKSVNSTSYSQFDTLYKQYKDISKNRDLCVQMHEHNLDPFITFLEKKYNY